MATNTLHIRVRADGTRVVTKQIGAVGNAANAASKNIFYLNRALGTLFAASGLRGISRMVNEYTEMNNKIRTVIKSESQLTGTRKKLLAASAESRTSMSAVTQLYTRTTRAAKGLGKSEGELIRFTKALSKETILSGASSIESANAIRQLTQGMGPAGLKGEELRSVLEQLPTVAEAIANQMGVTTGELRKLGSEGEITGEIIIEAFLAAEESINERFKKSLVTLPQAMQVLTDQATNFFGELDEGLGISRALSRTILELSSDIGGNLETALTLAASASVLFIKSLGKVGIASAPFIALAFTFKEIDSLVRSMTGGTSGLGLVFKIAAEAMQDFAKYIKAALADMLKLIAATEDLPNFQDWVDGLAAQASITPADDARIRREALEKTLKSGLWKQTVAKNPEFAGLGVSELDKFEAADSGPFVQRKNPPQGAVAKITESLYGSLVQKITGEPIKVDFEPSPLRKIFETEAKSAREEFLSKSFDEGSPAQNYLKDKEKEFEISSKQLRIQQQLLATYGELQGALQSAGSQSEQFKAVTDQIADAVDGVKDRAEGLNPANIEETKAILDQLQPLLEQIQKTQALEESIGFETDQVQAKVESLDTLLEKTRELPPEAAANAENTITTAAQTADAAIVAAAERSAQLVLQSYQQVLAGAQALAAGAGVSGAATQELLPGVTNPGKLDNGIDPFGPQGAFNNNPGGVASPPSDSNPIEGLIGIRDELKGIRNETEELANTSPGAFKRMGDAARNFGQTAQDVGNEFEQAFSSIFGSLEDALVSFVTTGKLDFKSLINSIIADLARMVVRMLIIRPLMGFFGGFFGGIFGFSGGGAVNNAFGLPSFAGGGLIQDNPATPQRFASGGRVHGPGTGVSDSVRALLSRDEYVVQASAARNNMAGLEYLNKTGRMPGGGGVTTVAYSPNVTINVEGNGDSAASNGTQIAKDFEAQMRAQFNEFVEKEKRPGGAFSKTEDDVI